MKNTYKVNNWKYPLLFLGVTALITGFVELLAVRGIPISNPASGWLSFIALLPIALSFISTSAPEFLSQKVRSRLKWLFAQPGINQYYHLFVIGGVTIFAAYVLKSVSSWRLFASFDLAVNTVGCCTILVAGYLLLRILRNN